MAINFPPKPQPDGKEYVDPNSGKWVYDLSNNSWTLVAPGNVSPFNYRGGHDFASATAPTNVKSGDAWTHSGTDGAAINAVYIGMTGTIAAGQFVVFDGSEYTKVSSVAGYPNVGDGDGATLDTRYVKKKGETAQGIEGKLGIGTDAPISLFHLKSSGAEVLQTMENSAGTVKLYSNNKNFIVDADQHRFRSESGSEHVRIDSSGSVSIGSGANAQQKLQVYDDSDAQILIQKKDAGQLRLKAANDADGHMIRFGGSGTGGVKASTLRFVAAGDEERIRIDEAGRLLVRTDDVIPSGNNASGNQICLNGSQTIFRNSANSICNYLEFVKQRGDGAIVQNGDNLGQILFEGSDSANPIRSSAIVGTVDGNPAYAATALVKDTEYRIVTAGNTDFTAIGAANNNAGTVFTATGPGTGTGTAVLSAGNMPGRLTFLTTPDGGANPLERMRISSDGKVTLGGGTPNAGYAVTIKNFPPVSNNSSWGFANAGIVPAEATSQCNYSLVLLKVNDTDVTYDNVYGYRVFQSSYGTNPTVTNNIGFNVDSTLTGGTNNFGFRSQIAAGTGRWNFYASGDALNYFNGTTSFANTADGIQAGSAGGLAFVNGGGFVTVFSTRTSTAQQTHFSFRNPNGAVGGIITDGSTTTFSESSDYRLKENIAPLTGAADQVKALKPCVYNFKADPDTTLQGFIAHEAQEVCPQAVTGTKDQTEAIGTLFDYDGSVREENVTEPEELTYSEEVIDDPGQEGKEAVYGEPVLIQEYQPAVYGDPELIKAADEESDAVYGDPVLISPEVPEQWSEPELISPAVEEREPTYKTVTRQMTWKKTGDRDVMQGIDKSKLVPLLTAALQEALGRIEALEAAIATKGA